MNLTLGDYYKAVARRLKADHGWKQGPILLPVADDKDAGLTVDECVEHLEKEGT